MVELDDTVIEADALYEFLKNIQTDTNGEKKIITDILKFVEEKTCYPEDINAEEEAYKENEAFDFAMLVKNELKETFNYSEKEANQYTRYPLIEDILNCSPEYRGEPIEWAVDIILENQDKSAVLHLLNKINKK